MLWTDRYFVTSTDMAQIEPEVADVAASNNIVVDGSNGLIEIVRQELQNKILADMQRFGGFMSVGVLSGNHLAAVFNTGGQGVNRSRITMGQVVVDPFVPAVKNWFMYMCLARFYRTAHARTTEDRYIIKMTDYLSAVANEYYPNLKNIGLPMVFRPLQAPGALFERSAGSWGTSNVSQVAGSGTAGGSFRVAVTYVSQTNGYINSTSKNNSESYISDPQSITVTAGNVAKVDVTSLNPPNGTVNPADLALVMVTPLPVTGWNVYVGTATGPLYLQNASPIPMATKTYTLAADPTSTGAQSDNGQYADNYFTMQDTLQRG